jgi:NADPH2:quinone reductase
MRAFIVPEFGERGAVGERPTPRPGEGQILVRVNAAGVNTMDAGARTGMLKDYMDHRLPLTPGTDYAGTVEAVGPGVTGFEVGDEVFGDVGKPYVGEGSFAEYVTVAADLAARRPEQLTPEQAAALPRAAGTALAAVDALGGASGDTIAIVGAAGGVGGFATQLAAERGLRVIAVTRSDHAQYVRDLGASDVIDYTSQDIVEELKRREPDGVAGIIDLHHDAQGLLPLVPAVRPGGRIVSSIAMGADQVLADQPVSGILVAAAVDRAAELGELAATGRITVPIQVLPLHQAADALDRQGTQQVRGKQVLVLEDGRGPVRA